MSRIIRFELRTHEPRKVIDFYARVFGWSFIKADAKFDYWLVRTGDDESPGINGGLSIGSPVRPVVNTILVRNLDATLEQIELHGGKVLSPRGSWPGDGSYASFEDPGGNQFGLEEAATPGP